MNRTEFIAELTAAIRDLSKDDVARVLEYYGEMIDERVEDGMSESEAVAALGSVDAIAAQIMKDIPRERNTLPEHYGQHAAAGSERAANETYTVEEPFNSLDVRLIAADVRILNSRDGETRIETSGDESVGETVEVRDGVLTVVQEAPRRQNVKFGGILTGILDVYAVTLVMPVCIPHKECRKYEQDHEQCNSGPHSSPLGSIPSFLFLK